MILSGKFLVRRGTTTDGKPVVVICGTFEPNVPIADFDERDEMWAGHLIVGDVIRFANTNNLQTSPEDFLENFEGVQAPQRWTRKDKVSEVSHDLAKALMPK